MSGLHLTAISTAQTTAWRKTGPQTHWPTSSWRCADWDFEAGSHDRRCTLCKWHGQQPQELRWCIHWSEKQAGWCKSRSRTQSPCAERRRSREECWQGERIPGPCWTSLGGGSRRLSRCSWCCFRKWQSTFQVGLSSAATHRAATNSERRLLIREILVCV